MTDTAFFPSERAFISPETYDAFFAVIERLETAIERETVVLGSSGHGDITEFTRQKRQGFLELNRIMRALEHTIPSQDLLARLSTFRVKLEANDAMLRRHLKAAEQVTSIIVRVMQDYDSDGTYSRASSFEEFA